MFTEAWYLTECHFLFKSHSENLKEKTFLPCEQVRMSRITGAGAGEAGASTQTPSCRVTVGTVFWPSEFFNLAEN